MTLLLVIALLFYLAGAFYSIILFATRNETRSSRLQAIIIAGFISHTLAIATDWWQLGHFPIVNPKEVSSFIGWAIVVYYLGMSFRYHARALQTFILPLVFVFVLSSILLPGPEHPVLPVLQGAINANLITKIIFPTHVTLVILSYAAFIMTFVSGVMYLMQEHELKTKHFGAVFQRLPALNTCDEIGYRSLTVGFVLLTLGVATGIIWNNQRDGRYWHNDPKEVMALVTWLVYLFIIHYRLTAGWRGRKVALLSIAGFIVVILTWLGARTLGGYHVFD